MIPDYPQSTEFSLALRPLLHPLFQQLPDGISEFTFANLYLFREGHHYRLATLPDGKIVITGRDKDHPFFMLPFGLPALDILQTLFAEWKSMKCVSASQAERLRALGYTVQRGPGQLRLSVPAPGPGGAVRTEIFPEEKPHQGIHQQLRLPGRTADRGASAGRPLHSGPVAGAARGSGGLCRGQGGPGTKRGTPTLRWDLLCRQPAGGLFPRRGTDGGPQLRHPL